MKLITIPYSGLLKVELPRFAERLIELLEKHNPEELKIEELFDLLVAETPTINKLIDKYGPHPLTKELRDLQKMRALRISEIRFRLKVVVREDKSGDDKDVNILKNELNHFFQNLELSKNEEMFNQKITQFTASIATNSELSAALESLDFIYYINNLRLVHGSIQNVIYDRMVSISERPQETTKELKQRVLKATKDLIKQIEIAPLINPEIDYAPLYSEINQLLAEYKVLINKRVLFNKRRAEMSDNNQSTQMAVTSLIADSVEEKLHPNTKEASMNESEVGSVENEEAATMSSKTVQLPLVDNNGTLEK
ncbi:MAG: hypothetical protein GX921_05790 [Bacteroidales bacterium]|nr:hypothetical protein [Bacteroidales bacterium]